MKESNWQESQKQKKIKVFNNELELKTPFLTLRTEAFFQLLFVQILLINVSSNCILPSTPCIS